MAAKQRKASNPVQHGYSRSNVPSMNSIQAVRKTVYSQIAPSVQPSYTQTVLNRNSNNNTNTNKRSAVVQQQLNGSLNSSKGPYDGNSGCQNQVNSNPPNIMKTFGMPQNPTSVIGIRSEDSQTSSLLAATSPMNRTGGIIGGMNGQTARRPLLSSNDDSTAGQTVFGSTGGLKALSTAITNAKETANCMLHDRDLCVSVELLKNTVKALVEHFDNRISELTVGKAAMDISSTTAGKASSQNSSVNQRKQHQQPKPNGQVGSGSILAKIDQIISQQAIINAQTQKDIVLVEEPVLGDKITSVQVENEKENMCPSDQNSPAKKSKNVNKEETFQQLTIAQVPPNEESAPSAKAGNTSSRSLPKSSRSRKIKNENAPCKVTQPQPFRPTHNGNATAISGAAKSTSGATTPQAMPRKKSVGRKAQTNSITSQASRMTVLTVQNSMQSLFKPNPNFAGTKNRRSSRSRSKNSPQQPIESSSSSHFPTNSPGDLSARLTGSMDVQNQAKSIGDHLAVVNPKTISCLIASREGSLEHFQDIMNSSHSLLKSISKEGDSAHGKLILQQVSGHPEDAKTPCMGKKDEFLLSSEAKAPTSPPKDSQEPFRPNTNANTSQNSSQATSTFKVDKPNCLEASFSNECQEETFARDHSQQSSVKEMTPDKGNDNLLHLLSNLEGLTPAGLEYLVQTQDKLATQTVVQKHKDEDSDKSDQYENLSQKANHENFNAFTQNKIHQYPQTMQRASSVGMRSLEVGNVRQQLNFVDVSDGTSPTPSITKYSNATPDLKLANEQSINVKDHVQKRLVYDTLQTVTEPANRRSQQSVVTPRMSMSGQMCNNADKASMQRTSNNTRRQKSTKSGHQQRNSVGTKNELLTLKSQSVLDARRSTLPLKQSQLQQNSRNQSTALGTRGNLTTGTQKPVTPRVNAAKQHQSQTPQVLNSSINGKSPNNQTLSKKASVETFKQNLTARGQQQWQTNEANTERVHTGSFKDLQIPVPHPDSNIDHHHKASSKIDTNQTTATPRINDSTNGQPTKCTAQTRFAQSKTQLQQYQSDTSRENTGGQSSKMLSATANNPMTQSTRSLTTMAEPAPPHQLVLQYSQSQNVKKGSKVAKNNTAPSQSIHHTNSSTRFEDRFKQLSRLVEKHQTNSLESSQKSTQHKNSSPSADMQQPTTRMTAQRPQIANPKPTTAATTVPVRTGLWHQSSMEVLDNIPKSTEKMMLKQQEDNELKKDSEQLMIYPEADRIQDEFCYDVEDVDEKITEAEDEVDNNQDARKSITSEKVLLRNRSIFSSAGGTQHIDQNHLCSRRSSGLKHQIMSVASSSDKIDNKEAATDQQQDDSLGSLEKQIQQIEISRDLFQRMEIDYKDIKITEAGHVFEPSDANRYCEMLRPNLAEDELNPYSIGEFLKSAVEMEPSCLMRVNPLNLSIDDNEQLPIAAAYQNQRSTETQMIMHDGEIGNHFEQNTSNVSFG